MITNFNEKYSGTIIGGIFTLVVFVTTFTIVIPIITLILPALLESILSLFIENKEYKPIGIGVLIILLFIFIFATIIMLRAILTRGKSTKKTLWIYFAIQFFIIPVIVFYFKTSSDWNQASDGQFFFGIYEVFPISSLAFITIGVLVDVLRNRKNSNIKNTTST
jgi:hypothetical protein